MYRISREFSFPMGHRLSKHSGRCQYVHGHNFKVIVEVGSQLLNENDMVMDFGDLNKIVEEYIDKNFDHSLALNKNDPVDMNTHEHRVVFYQCDPTAEVIAKNIFGYVQEKLDLTDVSVCKVTVYENDKSSATYGD